MPIAERSIRAQLGEEPGSARRIVWLAMSITGLVVAMTAVRPGPRAEPLAKEACDAIGAEHAVLVAAGIPETLKKGAVWGRANLSAAKLKEVERYIGLEEQLQFRCGLARLRVLPGGEGEETGDPDKASDKPAAETVAPPAAIAPRPAPKPKPKPKAIAKDAAPASEPVAAQSIPTPKPKPKPRADDAFRPPPVVKE